MAQNILITGAAGYIGGTILADFVSRTSGPLAEAKIFAAVRTEEQATRLSSLPITTVQIDLHSEAAVHKTIVRNDIDIVLHLASSMEPELAKFLIDGLGQRRKASGKDVFFVHSSVTALFAPENGWSYGVADDSSPTLFEQEKTLQKGNSNPVREANTCVVEESEKQGVTSFIVVVPLVYGRGSGEWRKLSSSIPSFVRSSIKEKVVYKFDREGNQASVHISDLTALYGLLTERILRNESSPNGKQGYYLAIAHQSPTWTTMDRLAKALHARGLVSEAETKFWPNDAVAAESLEWPPQFARAMGTSTGEYVTANATQIGWKPKWDQERFLKSLDDEIQDVLEVDTVRPSIYNALMPKK